MVDLSKRKYSYFDIDANILKDYLGGRGLAVRLLWDLNPVGVDPLSPENHLIFAVGPLTGYPLPSSSKLVIASKSPLTGGYGDGNIGVRAAVEIRRLGVDALVLKGRSEKPVLVHVTCKGVEFVNADHLWGLGAHEAEDKILREFGRDVGVLLIGPAGEKQVRFATVVAEFGRSGGRPGMGAVMGSKNVKALVVKGCKMPRPYDEKELRSLGTEAYLKIKELPNYGFWMRQGTMATVEWAQKASVLPTYNFSEGVFEDANKIDGYTMESMKVYQKGCPLCNMPCGHNVRYEVRDQGIEGRAELDYENVAMLGSNIGIGDLNKVAYLNKLADDYGVDTISLGNVIGFAMEATANGLIRDEGIEWGDFKSVVELVRKIVYGEGIGSILSQGVKRASEVLKGGSHVYAMHVKGLEVTAYDCHAAPAMALAYATSPIGAHHKDAWIIAYEVQTDRLGYTEEKVRKLIWLQNIRGGLFESLVACRLPWVELGLDLNYYPRLLKAATGVTYTWEDLEVVANRIYTLIRAYWIREFKAQGIKWSREFDYPPPKWFEKPLTKGPLAGTKLDREKFTYMLLKYYELRGWDSNGIPKVETLKKLGLGFVQSYI